MHRKYAIHYLIIFAVWCVISLSAQTAPSPEISIKEQKTSLVSLLEELSRQTSCYFSYPSDIVTKEMMVTPSNYQGIVEDFLPSLFTQDIVVTKFKNQFIIRLSDEVAPEKEDNTSTIILIRGAVVDEKNKPIPYASISITGTMLGTTTNTEGEFELKTPLEQRDSTVQISCMGYYDQKITISDFPQNEPIRMHKAHISLQEVIIEGVGTYHIINEAKSKLKKKYRTTPYSYKAFYREYTSTNNKHNSYSEALFDGYSPKSKYAKDRLTLTKARKLTNTHFYQDTVYLKLKGGTEAVLSLDIAHFLPDFLENGSESIYDYKLTDIQIWQNEQVYIVSFQPKKKNTEASFNGELYISKKDYILKGANFRYNKAYLQSFADHLILKKNKKMKIEPHQYQYWVEYQKLKNLYHISYVRGEIAIKARMKKRLRYSSFETTFEMVVNDIDTTMTTKPQKRKIFRSSSVFSEEIEANNEAFWELENLIVPEKEIMDAFYESSYILEQQALQ